MLFSAHSGVTEQRMKVYESRVTHGHGWLRPHIHTHIWNILHIRHLFFVLICSPLSGLWRMLASCLYIFWPFVSFSPFWKHTQLSVHPSPIPLGTNMSVNVAHMSCNHSPAIILPSISRVECTQLSHCKAIQFTPVRGLTLLSFCTEMTNTFLFPKMEFICHICANISPFSGIRWRSQTKFWVIKVLPNNVSLPLMLSIWSNELISAITVYRSNEGT